MFALNLLGKNCKERKTSSKAEFGVIDLRDVGSRDWTVYLAERG